ncbi:MerR family DNA-binding transcriptional regulator [Streptomyces lavendulae]
MFRTCPERSARNVGRGARSGLSVHALRFYEREGLFANPVRRLSNGRLSNGRRVYHGEER